MTVTHEFAQQTDATLSRLYGEQAQLDQAFSYARNLLHKLAGDVKKPGLYLPVQAWEMSDEKARHLCVDVHGKSQFNQARKALQEKYNEVKAKEKEYTGWSRFFLVTNVGGHIHSSTRCSTCFPSTSYAWLTDISSLSEGEAVAKHGERLCTVCFPSAPVEWTEGYARKSKEEVSQRKAEREEKKAQKEAKRAAFWEVRHYGIRRKSDGHIYGGTEWERERHGQTFKTAEKDAKEMGSEWEVIDLLTMAEPLEVLEYSKDK